MAATFGYVLAHIVPEASVVLIVRVAFKLLTHAIDDKDRWSRLLVLAVPLLVALLALVGVAVWWLLCDGGVQVLVRDFGRT